MVTGLFFARSYSNHWAVQFEILCTRRFLAQQVGFKIGLVQAIQTNSWEVDLPRMLSLTRIFA